MVACTAAAFLPLYITCALAKHCNCQHSTVTRPLPDLVLVLGPDGPHFVFAVVSLHLCDWSAKKKYSNGPLDLRSALHNLQKKSPMQISVPPLGPAWEEPRNIPQSTHITPLWQLMPHTPSLNFFLIPRMDTVHSPQHSLVTYTASYLITKSQLPSP